MQYVIVGDVHLTRDAGQRVARDLASVVRSHRDATLVFAGDMVDLAAESIHGAAAPALGAVMGAHEDLRVALAEHVAAGRDVWVLAGNHDEDVGTPAGAAALADALGLEGADRARLHTSPWFARLGEAGALHVEHGHHYDPDNATPHPLAPPDPAWRSLGIGMMHAFVAPAGAHAIVHANDGTPMQCLKRAFEIFGPRTPAVIARYFAAAAGQFTRAGRRYPHDRARALGDAAVPAFAARWELPADAVARMVARGATPTLASRNATFFRLYWDRVLSAAVTCAAGTSVALGGPGSHVAVGAAAVLVASMAQGNRYRGRVPGALVASSEDLVEGTGARAVVFGHIHAPVASGAYKNTGSFAFPGAAPGRPYVRVDGETCETWHAFFRAPALA